MKKKINYTKFPTKSFNLLYLLNKRNNDIKNKTQLFKTYQFFFLNFNNYLLYLSKRNVKITQPYYVVAIRGLYRQVNLLNKYACNQLKYSNNIQIKKINFNHPGLFMLYFSSTYNLYKLLLILNQNLYVIN